MLSVIRLMITVMRANGYSGLTILPNTTLSTLWILSDFTPMQVIKNKWIMQIKDPQNRSCKYVSQKHYLNLRSYTLSFSLIFYEL